MHWLGFDWEDRLFYASDYFGKLYEFGETLIRSGKAYVCDLTADEVRATAARSPSRAEQPVPRPRAPTRAWTSSAGCAPASFPTARARCARRSTWRRPTSTCAIPALYRIRKATHHRTGDAWCIYPMYDYAHALSDWIEGITHSLCTLEFEDHRPLYDWCLEALGPSGPAAPDRVRPPEPHVHAALEAEAPPARDGRPRDGLGRPADAHARGPPAPRLHARGAPRLLQPHRPRQARQRRRGRAARALPARGPEPPRAARHGRPRPRAASSSRTARKGRSRSWTPSTTPRTRRRERARCRSRASCSSTATTSARCRRRSTTGSRPGRKCACAGATSSAATEVVKDPATGVDHGAAVHLRPRDAGRRRARGPEGEGDDSLGVGGARARRRGPPLRPALLRLRTPTTRPRDGDFLANLNPDSLVVKTGCRVEPSLSSAKTGDVLPVRARRLLHRRPGQRSFGVSSSTGPSRCATRGARSRRRRAAAT